MELKDLLKIVKSNLIVLILTAALGAVLAGALSVRQPAGVKAQALIYVNIEMPQTQSVYTYDGYYTQERARNFTDTAATLIQESNLGANLGPKDSYSVKKLAPQILRLTVYSTNQQGAFDVLKKVEDAAGAKVSKLTNGEINLKIVDEPRASGFGPSRKIYILAGVVAGLAFAILVVSFKTYFDI